MKRKRDERRASNLEILGAWLRVWTPPRDCYVPPVPWRKVAAGAGVLLLVGMFVALVVAPAIDESKEQGAAEERAAAERRAATRRAAIEAEQRARTGRLPAAASRLEALAFVEERIGRDARARFGAAGDPAGCDEAPGEDLSAARVVFDCHVTVTEIRGAGEQEGASGALTVPYRAALDFTARRYAFCKTNPKPGEAAAPDPRSVVELPAACGRR